MKKEETNDIAQYFFDASGIGIPGASCEWHLLKTTQKQRSTEEIEE